jgi:uncharacterized protein
VTSERPLLSISRKTLDEGPKEVRAVLPAAWLARRLGETGDERPEEGVRRASGTDAPLSSSRDGKVDVWVTPAGGENFLVKGTVDATVDTQCARCLDQAHVPVHADVTLLVVPEKAAGARPTKGKKSKDSEGEFEFDADEADVATYDGETVVLDDLVREAILLEMPISPLCSEDCAGMASDPAAAAILDRARVDPRLSPLAALRDKLPAGGQADPTGPRKK